MLLSKIEIENFRSINTKLTVNLHKKTVLVGKNNTGKSNVLKAIDLVLGERYPRVSKNDFYNQNESNEIKIGLEFTNVTTDEVANITRFLNYDKYGHASAELDSTRKIRINFSIGLGGQSKELYFGDEYYKYFSNDIKESMLSSVYIPALRDHNQILKVTEYSFFNKLLSKIYANSDIRKKTELEQALLIAAEKCKNIFNDSEVKLDAITKSIIDHKGIRFSFLPSDRHSIYKKISLLLNDGIETELDFKGSGIQSAVIISMFKLYADLKIGSAILLIEEPESFLHPHANRHMAKVLNEISKEEDIQVIFTTHSPYYLMDTDVDNISLVKKKENKTVINQPSLAGIDKTKLKKEMSVDNLELFFADKVVLVEGATEKILLPSIALQINANYDFDRHNISLIEVGSKSNFLIFLKLLKAYEKEWHVIIDKDILDTVSRANLNDIASFSGVNIDGLPVGEIIRALKSKNIYILSYGEIENYYSKSWLYDLLEDIIKGFEPANPVAIAELIGIIRGFEDSANLDIIKRDIGARFRDYFDKMEPILNIKRELISLDINRPKISNDLKSVFKNIDLNSKPRIAVKVKDHADITKMEGPKRNELTEIITKIVALGHS